MITQELLTQAIYEKIAQYRKNGVPRSAINAGWCETFAEDIHAGFSLDPLLHVRNDAEMEGKDDSYLEHAFLEFKGRFYDSDAPEGVDFWRDLPFFQGRSGRK